MNIDLKIGNCLDVMKTMDDSSVDSIVTDPPYGLSFMGKKWDIEVPSVEIWAECLRVLKPGGHLLAFAGTRTQHRMACNIEDAGFEIRDMIAWVYGSGFPKSLNISKAMDAFAKTGRTDSQVTGDGRSRVEGQHHSEFRKANAVKADFEPSTDAAKQWDGWGTATKPAFEPLTVATKPLSDDALLNALYKNLSLLECRLWLLSYVNVAGEISMSNLVEQSEGLNFAQWSVDQLHNTLEDLLGLMDMSQLKSRVNICLNIVFLWKNILVEISKLGNTSTTKTKIDQIIELKILNYCILQITPSTIIRAVTNQGGVDVNATHAEVYLSAELAKLNSILALSVVENVILSEVELSLDVVDKVKLEPITVARKPLSEPTVASNVIKFGTGGINIDACRVGMGSEVIETVQGQSDSQQNGLMLASKDQRDKKPFVSHDAGRWPANFIHDGSDEVVELFPITGKSAGGGGNKAPGKNGIYGSFKGHEYEPVIGYGDEGSAARFFYCPKTNKKDRNEGLDDFEEIATAFGNQAQAELKRGNLEHDQGSSGMNKVQMRKNNHPTVKPTDLMRYLVRLVTPPNGTTLDPFMGSGSTGKAAILEGFNFVGIEMDETYFEIAKARIDYVYKNGTQKFVEKVKTTKIIVDQVNDSDLQEFFG